MRTRFFLFLLCGCCKNNRYFQRHCCAFLIQPFAVPYPWQAFFLFLVCYAVAILLAFVQMERKRYLSLGWVALVIAFHAFSPYMDRYGEVVLLDVGQGDCLYIELPYRKGVYLIDTGGTLPRQGEPWQERKREWDVGKDVVVPFLKSKGVRHIDKLIATHGDIDHIGAAAEIIHHLSVKQLVIGKVKTESLLQEKLVQLAKQKI